MCRSVLKPVANAHQKRTAATKLKSWQYTTKCYALTWPANINDERQLAEK